MYKKHVLHLGPEQIVWVYHLRHTVTLKERGIHVGIRQATGYKAQAYYRCYVNVIHLQGTISLFTGTTSQLTG